MWHGFNLETGVFWRCGVIVLNSALLGLICGSFPCWDKHFLSMCIFAGLVGILLLFSLVPYDELAQRERTPRRHIDWMNWVPRRPWLRALMTATIVLVVAIWGPYRFSYSSACSKCGCIRYTVEYQLPHSQISYWTSQKLIETPLSRCADSFTKPHEHDWEFSIGAGNGIHCALGSGMPIHRAAHSEQLAAFISATNKFLGSDAANYWLTLSLEPEQSNSMRNWLDINDFPDGPLDEVLYHNWRAQADRNLETYHGLTQFHRHPEASTH